MLFVNTKMLIINTLARARYSPAAGGRSDGNRLESTPVDGNHPRLPSNPVDSRRFGAHSRLRRRRPTNPRSGASFAAEGRSDGKRLESTPVDGSLLRLPSNPVDSRRFRSQARLRRRIPRPPRPAPRRVAGTSSSSPAAVRGRPCNPWRNAGADLRLIRPRMSRNDPARCSAFSSSRHSYEQSRNPMRDCNLPRTAQHVV